MADGGAPSHHLLRYTGSLDAAEFDQACATVDWWYHSYYFDNGLSVRGDYDIGADIDDYGFPEDMRGMEVLDIGTGAGWFAHYFAQRGAAVTTFDARGYADFDVFGRHYYPPHDVLEAVTPDIVTAGRDDDIDEHDALSWRPPDRRGNDGAAIYYSPVSKGFFVMNDILGTEIDFVNGRVYDIEPSLFKGKRFDLVFMGAFLCHLRDPIGALACARSVCRGTIIASTPVVIGEGPDEAPRQYLPYTGIDRISWWLPNEACFRLWFEGAGFSDVDVSRSLTLRCDVEHRGPDGRVHNGDQTHRVGRARV